MKTKRFTIRNINDRYFGDFYRQEVIDDETGKTVYSVQDLTDCPEDAVIYRDLVSAYQFLDFVRYGIELASQGYTDIVAEEIEGEDD
jgi:hypothetical protein